MTRYLVVCAVAAPALLITTLTFAAWVVGLLCRGAGQLVDQLVDDEQQPGGPVEYSRGCAELRQCATLARSHQGGTRANSH